MAVPGNKHRPPQMESTPCTTEIVRKEINKSELPTRPSYNPTVAYQFKGVFDKMMETQMNQEIHCAVVKLKANTLYIKANDGLKWLGECHPDVEERTRYALLRTKISIRRADDRIIIYWKATMSNMLEHATAAVLLGEKTWKQDLMTWIETAQDGDIFERQGVSISADDKIWLYTLLAGLGEGVEVDVQLNSVRVMR